MKVKAFILAAGLGTRLRPLTEEIPKPLVPLLGSPIIEYVLKNLSQINPAVIGINLHHRPEKILAWAKSCAYKEKFFFSLEEQILGTGGGIKKAEPFLRDSFFVVYNGDIFAEIDLREVLKFHLEKGALATLVVKPNPSADKIFMDEEGKFLGVDPLYVPERCCKKTGFTGIAVYSPEFLNFLPEGPSTVLEGWVEALKKGYPIYTYELKGAWFDIGTPASYLKTLVYLLRTQGENLYVCPEVATDGVEFQGYVSVEVASQLEKGTFLENVAVISPESIVSGRFKDGILGKDFFIQVPREQFLPHSEEGFLIGYGGSDRKFYRINGLVKMKVERLNEDFFRTVEFQKFFHDKGVKVPHILQVSQEKGEVFFEDLGDLSLYNWLKGKRNLTLIKEMYQKVLDEVVKLHTIPVDDAVINKFRKFDYEHFRWETHYFKEKFLHSFLKISDEEILKQEFEQLARISDSFPKNLIHRDLQCQNIMIKNGTPYLIDYQGARIGPPGYDIASLLWDPYYQLEKHLREELLGYYIEKRKKLDPYFEQQPFLDSLIYLRIQRHLQALGAYANLSLFKGKKYFLKFIPQALIYLREEVKELGWSGLEEMVDEIYEKLMVEPVGLEPTTS